MADPSSLISQTKSDSGLRNRMRPVSYERRIDRGNYNFYRPVVLKKVKFN